MKLTDKSVEFQKIRCSARSITAIFILVVPGNPTATTLKALQVNLTRDKHMTSDVRVNPMHFKLPILASLFCQRVFDM